MSNYKTSGNQLAKNTLYLYFRQFLTVVVSLYTVRIVLQTLGVEDFGIKNVVAGTVSMFGFLTGAMATGTQRFFSFYIGTGDQEKLKKVFQVTFTIYVLLAIFIVVLQEVVGLWLLNNKLVIPENRMFAAHWVFQIGVLTSFFGIMQSPFMASVVAHENMKIFAQVSIYDVIMRLLIVYVITIIPYDKLISYSILSFMIWLSTTVFYQYYTRKHYQECKSHICFERKMVKDILGFNGWNLFGQFAWMMKNQGISILLNMFFGPVINSAHQIGTQIRTKSVEFSQNFSVATKPQIIKSYAAADYDRMFKLVYKTAKLNFMLMLIITVPLLFHLDYILHLWLGIVPVYTVIICKLLLLENLVETTSLPFATVNQATGKIALYQFLIGLVGLLTIPFAYIMLRLGADASFVFIIGIILQCFIAAIRILFVLRIRHGILQDILIRVYMPCLLVAALGYLICNVAYFSVNNLAFLVSEILLELAILFALIYLVGMNAEEKMYFRTIVLSRIKSK